MTSQRTSRSSPVTNFQVDPAVIEAATGLGMTDAERLRLVELPLALPVIATTLFSTSTSISSSAAPPTA